ncbi:hypothetical protein G9A89_017994 [Geosiphon pyriformis]|nr:hypothetical protein G9A89_017994 [Geosiphon pyriformis]
MSLPFTWGGEIEITRFCRAYNAQLIHYGEKNIKIYGEKMKPEFVAHISYTGNHYDSVYKWDTETGMESVGSVQSLDLEGIKVKILDLREFVKDEL